MFATFRSIVRRFASQIRGYLLAPLYSPPLFYPAAEPHRSDAATHVALGLTYREMLRTGAPLPKFQEVGFHVYSQVDEDGILLYIFALIGTTNRRCVEICAGSGIECNTSNLIINHFWTGLLFDGDAANIERGRKFYENSAVYVFPPQLVHVWITRSNINDLVRDHGFEGEIDLLSIDMDGIDYWLWEAIEVIKPRVVVVEYQCTLGPERSCTVPYSDDFNPAPYAPGDCRPSSFSGATLAAFRKLGKKKGYRFVGCNALGFNAFFIRDGIGEDIFPEIPHDEWFRIPKVVMEMKMRGEDVGALPWVDI